MLNWPDFVVAVEHRGAPSPPGSGLHSLPFVEAFEYQLSLPKDFNYYIIYLHYFTSWRRLASSSREISKSMIKLKLKD